MQKRRGYRLGCIGNTNHFFNKLQSNKMKNTIIPTSEIDIKNTSTIPNTHIFKVTFIPQNDNHPARVKIRSEYWQKSKVFSFGDGTHGDNTIELAVNKISGFGFNIVAKANHSNHYLLISDTFTSELVNPFSPAKKD